MKRQAENVSTSPDRAAALLRTLSEEMFAELTSRILPYWSEHTIDEARGGFVGRIDHGNVVRRDAPKGSVLNARILWTFSAAYRTLGDPALRDMADRAAEYFTSFFIDPVHGGAYWMVDASGRPLDVRKHVYAQSFAIYALSEHHQATGSDLSLRRAIDIFRLLERHAHQARYEPSPLGGRVPGGGGNTASLPGGYDEAFTHDWAPLQDIRMNATRHSSAGLFAASAMSAVRSVARLPRRISPTRIGGVRRFRRLHSARRDEDAGARRSMNTHLHVLEAFTALYRAWPDALLQDRLCGLIAVFLDRMIDADNGHLYEFFDGDWTPRPGVISYGHDIEASWLLLEAAGTGGYAGLQERARHVSLRLAEAVLEEAVDNDGGIAHSAGGGEIDTDREWWTQAEAIVGFLNAYQESGRRAFLDAAIGTWAFVRRNVLDTEHGEWHRRVSRDGTVHKGHEKVGPWKGPYHNARACLEVIRRVDRIRGD